MPQRNIIRQALSLAASLILWASNGYAQSGRAEIQLEFNGVELQVSHEASLSQQHLQKLKYWLDDLTASMLLLHGAQPHETLRIELNTFAGGSRAVPFGQVIRRRTPGVRFYVNPDLELATFRSDWTPYHEVSHLFIPYPGQSDIWLSEGLASYYQNVLRYRAGVLSERDAWNKLISGFKRARDDRQHTDFTLRELSDQLRNRRAYMRVYWSGALYFLEADMQLRTQSNNTQSLDTVLRDFGECCLNARRRWAGREIVQRFDELAGIAVFEPLYNKYARSLKIPDYSAVLARAGIVLATADATAISVSPLHDLAGIPSPSRP